MLHCACACNDSSQPATFFKKYKLQGKPAAEALGLHGGQHCRLQCRLELELRHCGKNDGTAAITFGCCLCSYSSHLKSELDVHFMFMFMATHTTLLSRLRAKMPTALLQKQQMPPSTSVQHTLLDASGPATYVLPALGRQERSNNAMQLAKSLPKTPSRPWAATLVKLQSSR